MKMDDCIFCKIVEGEIAKKEIYSDEKVTVLMDVFPKSKGHILIIPNEHVEDIIGVSNNMILNINEIAKTMIEKLMKNLGCDGVEIVYNYGINQEIKHYHLHLIPTYADNSDKGYGYLKEEDIERTFELIKRG